MSELEGFLFDSRFLFEFKKNDLIVEEKDLFPSRGEDMTEEVLAVMDG